MYSSFNTKNASNIKESWDIEHHVLSNDVDIFDNKDIFNKHKICLIFLDSTIGKKVRYKLYGFTGIPGTRVLDAGDFLGPKYADIMDIVLWSIYHDVTPVIISQTYVERLYDLLLENWYGTNGLQISHISRNLFCHPASDKVERIVNVAYQTHRNVPEHIAYRYDIDLLRLGEIREIVSDVEPFVRHSHWTFFNLNAIRYSDAPAQKQPSSSGLFSEEACQLAKYAGSADFGGLLWIYGYEPSIDENNITADLISQIVWYYAQGNNQKRVETPGHSSSISSYVIEYDHIDIPLTFHKSNITARWWIEVHEDEKVKYVPCSGRDYLLAKKDELSDRLLKILNIYS